MNQPRSCVLLAALVAVAFANAASAADTDAPHLLSVTKVDPTDLNVGVAPAAATVKLEISDDTSGIAYYYVYWRSVQHTGQQVSTYEYSEFPRKSGFVFAQSPRFSIYSAAGDWDLSQVTLCDRAGNCRYYYGADLDAINPHRKVHVTNTHSPDTVAPSVSEGEVMTTAPISLSKPLSARRFHVRLKPDDDNSGVSQAFACFKSPDNSQSNCANAGYSRPAKGSVEYTEGTFYDGTDWVTGTWHLYEVDVYDVPGNVHSVTNAGELDAMFPGGRTIEVDP
jgi:hypothetical protein